MSTFLWIYTTLKKSSWDQSAILLNNLPFWRILFSSHNIHKMTTWENKNVASIGRINSVLKVFITILFYFLTKNNETYKIIKITAKV